MAEPPRYPKRIRKISSALEPYLLDYDSDEDIHHDLDLQEEVVEDFSDLSSCSEDEGVSISTNTSYMDQSNEFTSSDGRDGTVWSDVNKSIPSDNLPIEHVPNLTPYSQNATTILGELTMW